MSVVSIGRDEIIILSRSRKRTNHNCLLANVKVAEAADLLRLILLAGAFFETPDQQHQREHLDLVALRRLHGGHAVREIAARTRERSRLRPTLTVRTKIRV